MLRDFTPEQYEEWKKNLCVFLAEKRDTVEREEVREYYRRAYNKLCV